MKLISIISSVFILSVSISNAEPSVGNPLLNGDGFYSNCSEPAFGSFTKHGNTLVFRLKDKDIGGCSSDSFARHSAPYWERIELKQGGYLEEGEYSFAFDLKVEGGYSDRTTIFQLHTYSSDCKSCKPFFMLKLNEDGTLSDNNNSYIDTKITLGNFYNIRLDFAVVEKFQLSKGGSSRVKVIINGKPVKTYEPWWDGQGSPHIKFGIYRPGNEDTPNPTAIHTVKNIVFKRLK